jgi:hypothetical protein
MAFRERPWPEVKMSQLGPVPLSQGSLPSCWDRWRRQLGQGSQQSVIYGETRRTSCGTARSIGSQLRSRRCSDSGSTRARRSEDVGVEQRVRSTISVISEETFESRSVTVVTSASAGLGDPKVQVMLSKLTWWAQNRPLYSNCIMLGRSRHFG